MSLIDLERDIQRVCLERNADQATLKRLGREDIFQVYREMVRRRLYGELKFALKRTYVVAGEDFFREAFETFMAEQPPRSRFFHAIPVEFAARMAPHFEQHCATPEAASLLRFEATRWQVSDLPAPEPGALREFDFDHPVVLTPTLRLLALDYPVHHETDAPQAKKSLLAIYRSQHDAPVRHFHVNPVTFDLLSFLSTRGGSVSEAVRHVSQARKLNVDQAFIDGLCSVLSDFIERGVILGVRAEQSTAT